MVKRWLYSKVNEGKIKEVAEKNNISELLAKVLLGRGIETDADIDDFLHPKIQDLYDPFLLNDMEKAVTAIIDSCNKKEKITIYGDYDVDGITSTAILKKFFADMEVDSDYYLPSRLEEGYGLNNEALEKIAKNGTKLLITVDCGISAYEEVEYAKKLGMKVIVTDHHECPEKLPDAVAVVDAKRKDNTYPFVSLAGVGVTFKLIQAISLKLELDRKRYLKYIDIVALGTIADIVPLIDENRIIVKYGLILMRETRNVGLQALIRVSGYERGDNLNSTAISFGVAPRMNASGRMGKADLALQLLLEDDIEKAYKIALELSETNKERQNVEKEIIEQAMAIIEKDKLYERDIIVIAKEKWHHGVIGIVASKITELYYKPTILISINDGIGKGSGRSIEGFDLHDALTKCQDKLVRFGGHEMAIGLTINENSINEFKEIIEKIANESNVKELFPTIKVDAEVSAKNISHQLIKEIDLLKPFGESNMPPIFVYKGLKVEAVRFLSNDKHLKLSLKDESNVFEAIAFNIGKKGHSVRIGDKLDVLHTIETNFFNGIEKIQMNIKDLKKSL